MSTTAVAELELQPANKRSALGDGEVALHASRLGEGAVGDLAQDGRPFFGLRLRVRAGGRGVRRSGEGGGGHDRHTAH